MYRLNCPCGRYDGAIQTQVGSGMLGHYSAGFTLDTYAHVTTQSQRQAADTMANILSDAI